MSSFANTLCKYYVDRFSGDFGAFGRQCLNPWFIHSIASPYVQFRGNAISLISHRLYVEFVCKRGRGERWKSLENAQQVCRKQIEKNIILLKWMESWNDQVDLILKWSFYEEEESDWCVVICWRFSKNHSNWNQNRNCRNGMSQLAKLTNRDAKLLENVNEIFLFERYIEQNICAILFAL